MFLVRGERRGGEKEKKDIKSTGQKKVSALPRRRRISQRRFSLKKIYYFPSGQKGNQLLPLRPSHLTPILYLFATQEYTWFYQALFKPLSQQYKILCFIRETALRGLDYTYGFFEVSKKGFPGFIFP